METGIGQRGQNRFWFIQSLVGKKYDNNNNLEDKVPRQAMIGFNVEFYDRLKHLPQEQQNLHEQTTYNEQCSQTSHEKQTQDKSQPHEQEQKTYEQKKRKGTGIAKSGKKQKNKLHIKLFFKCFKKSMSTKRNRQIFFYESYCYLWDLLFSQ